MDRKRLFSLSCFGNETQGSGGSPSVAWHLCGMIAMLVVNASAMNFVVLFMSFLLCFVLSPNSF
jgi:hypothetical protein